GDPRVYIQNARDARRAEKNWARLQENPGWNGIVSAVRHLKRPYGGAGVGHEEFAGVSVPIVEEQVSVTEKQDLAALDVGARRLVSIGCAGRGVGLGGGCPARRRPGERTPRPRQ